MIEEMNKLTLVMFLYENVMKSTVKRNSMIDLNYMYLLVEEYFKYLKVSPKEI